MTDFFLKPFSFFEPAIFALPVMLILMGIELYFSTKNNLELYEKKDTVANVFITIALAFINVLGRIISYYFFVFMYQFRLMDIPNVWWAWVLLILADDFTYYWYHRLHHIIRILWAGHVVHHSSQKLNLSTPLREPWIVALYYCLFWLWLPLFGFQPWMVLTMISINLIYQNMIHTTLIGKLGFLELFMSTPSHHRVHHSSNVQYLDKNYGGIFIIWDKLFGTFQEENEKPVYGITHNINTTNPITINFHEYISIWKDLQKPNTLTNKIKYLFYRPGWRA